MSESSPSPTWSARLWQLSSRWLLPILTGVLMALSYPSFNIGECAWICLLPLLFAMEGGNPRQAFWRGYLAGAVFFGMTIWWTVHVTILGTVALIAVLALYFGAAATGFALVRQKTGAGDVFVWNLVYALVGTSWWVTLEWVRGHFLFGGFGWNGMGVSQHQTLPLIQIASITGVYGVSVLVVLVNFGIYFTVRRFLGPAMGESSMRRLSWELYAVVIVLCGAFLYGLDILRKEPATARGLRIALIQGNIPQSLKFDPNQKPMVLQRYRALTEKASLLKPELIIWPETALPDALRYDADSYGLATNMVARANAFLLTGSIDMAAGKTGIEHFNGAVLMGADGRLLGLYHKIHLVAFGEYVPLRKILPIFKYFTPIDGSFERGQAHHIFHLPNLRFGTVICFEDTLPDLYRKFVKQGVDFMVNLTNDGWFKESPAAEMHLANAIFRAVETRRPLVRCTNNGVTCVVDEYGHINPRQRLPLHQEGMLVCELALPHQMEVTFYTQHGDWLVGCCALISAAAMGWFAWQARSGSVKTLAFHKNMGVM